MKDRFSGDRDGGNHTILVVEDDTLFRKALTTYLASLGYTLVAAESGEAALEQIAHRRVDIGLIDYHLPGMNGIELVRALQAQQIAAPMILLSGFLSESVRREAAETSIVRVLRKPADMSILEATILDIVTRESSYGPPN